MNLQTARRIFPNSIDTERVFAKIDHSGIMPFLRYLLHRQVFDLCVCWKIVRVFLAAQPFLAVLLMARSYL